MITTPSYNFLSFYIAGEEKIRSTFKKNMNKMLSMLNSTPNCWGVCWSNAAQNKIKICRLHLECQLLGSGWVLSVSCSVAKLQILGEE